MVAEGDLVAYRATLSGTHRGELLGMAPTGGPSACSTCTCCACATGGRREHWAVRDDLGMLQQLGIIPAPAPPPARSARPQARPRSGSSRPGVVEGLQLVVAADRAVVHQDLGHGVAPRQLHQVLRAWCRCAAKSTSSNATPFSVSSLFARTQKEQASLVKMRIRGCASCEKCSEGRPGGAPGVRGAAMTHRMATYDTEAVVLRSIRYSEADVVLALLQRARGRVSAIAKGARRTTSRLGGRLQPGVPRAASRPRGTRRPRHRPRRRRCSTPTRASGWPATASRRPAASSRP